MRWPGEMLISKYDQPSASWIFIAIHSSKGGPATGGTRMMHYESPALAMEDAINLAESMTNKFAAINFPRGGGKAVIAIPDNLGAIERTELLQRYGKLIQSLAELFYTGPDVGTTSADMDIIAEHAPAYIFSRSKEKGGMGSSGPATAVTTFISIKATCRYLFNSDSLNGKKILVQGAGSVGLPLLDMLIKEGADVEVYEITPSIINDLKTRGIKIIPADKLYSTECDIFSPCALGGILSADTIPHLKCKAVVGAANNQLQKPQDALLLKERGILYAPDFIVNCGGAVAITAMEALSWKWEDVLEQFKSIEETLFKIYQLSSDKNISTHEAAQLVVTQNLSSNKTNIWTGK